MMNAFLSRLLQRQNGLSDALQGPEDVVNHRKLDRFPVGNGVYALLSWETTGKQFMLGHLPDINRDGCGILFITERSSSVPFHQQKPYRLQLMGGGAMMELRKASIVYDREIKRYSTDRLCARRCGILFDQEKNG